MRYECVMCGKIFDFLEAAIEHNQKNHNNKAKFRGKLK